VRIELEQTKMDQAANLREIVKLESEKVASLQREGGDSFLSGSDKPKVFTIASGKGGVGKTNIVVNLAIACQRIGKRVLVFDADLGLANIDIIFGLNPEYTIEELIAGKKDLSQIIVQGPEDVSIIPASSGVQELTNLTEGQKMHLLNEFDALNNRYDILLIDTGAGVSSNVIYFNLAAEERIVVVKPEPTSITDAYALIKIMFRQYGVKNFHLLMNMVSGESEAKNVYNNLSKVLGRFMRGIRIDYAGYIPTDNLLQKSVTKREPVLCSYPDASSSKSFEMLATYLLKQTQGDSSDGNIKFFWKRLITGVQDINDESYD
jgi:flagellar biosynthesis protein FlhG